MKKAIPKISLFIFLGIAILLGLNSYLLTNSNDNNLSNLDTSASLQFQKENHEDCCIFEVKNKALLSSRFNNLTQLQTTVIIKYDKDYLKMDSNDCRNSVVHLSYLSNGEVILRSMSSGVSPSAGILRSAPFSSMYLAS